MVNGQPLESISLAGAPSSTCSNSWSSTDKTEGVPEEEREQSVKCAAAPDPGAS
jgi:hypothetical protein